MNSPTQPDDGFAYELGEDEIRAYMKLSCTEKLQWLEDLLVFTEMTQSAETRRVREHFRNEHFRY